MSANPTYKPSEGKREEFRKYLEKNGVLDALTKVLVNLYEEINKPEDALEFIRDKLCIQAGLETNKQMQVKIDEAQATIKELEEKVEKLMAAEVQVPEGEAPPEEGAVPDEGAAPIVEEAPVEAHHESITPAPPRASAPGQPRTSAPAAAPAPGSPRTSAQPPPPPPEESQPPPEPTEEAT